MANASANSLKTSGGEHLSFNSKPTTYRYKKSFHWEEMFRLRQENPVAGYLGGGFSEFEFALVFDEDADGDAEICDKALSFFKKLSKLGENQRPNVLSVSFGSGVVFSGFVREYELEALVVGQDGRPDTLRASVRMISDDSTEAKN